MRGVRPVHGEGRNKTVQLKQDRAGGERIHVLANQVGQNEADRARAAVIAHDKAVSATAAALHEAAILQEPDRLTQRQAADAEPLAEIPFRAELLAGGAAANDLGRKPPRDCCRQGAVVGEAPGRDLCARH